MSIILGIDISPVAAGWSLIDEKDDRLIDCGVRIFQPGADNLNQSKEQPRNASRRQARSFRIQRRRKKFRKKMLKDKIIEMGLMPSNNDKDFFRINPYEARARGIHEKLAPHEIGRLLYHICKRRGYKSNRKTETDISGNPGSTKEPGIMAKRISDLHSQINESNSLTLGEYLSLVNPHKSRIRGRYTHREMYLREFNLIWYKQREYYPGLLNDENLKKIRDEIIFYQRPLRSQRCKVGKCNFEPGKKKAPKSSPVAQEFRIYRQVNSLRISGGGRLSDEEQQLSMKEADILINYLREHDKLDIKKPTSIINLLGLDKNNSYKINLSRQSRLEGMKTYCSIRRALGDDLFKQYSDYDLFSMWDVLYFAEDENWLIGHSMKRWGFRESVAKKFAKIKLEPGFINISTKAARKMMPWLKQGQAYYEAAASAGYLYGRQKCRVEIKETLPEPDSVPNPVLRKVLSQVRCVINELTVRYGKPDIIRAALSTDLKYTLERRLAILKSRKELKELHEKIKDSLKNEAHIENPTQEDILKYRLWTECNKTCPYTGKKISLEQLYVTKEFGIDHILPYSRTLDNSYMNLTLCLKSENHKKGNKTPWEFYGTNKDKMEEIKKRIKIFPDKKARRFFLSKIDSKDVYISGQLNDRSHASRLTRDYLKQITENVQVIKGATTGILRHFHGLNTILNESYDNSSLHNNDYLKNSEDHRHHAISSIITALTTENTLKKLSTYYRIIGQNPKFQSNQALLKVIIPFPWNNFRADVREKAANVIVSHKLNKRVRGPLHEETCYGLLKDSDGSIKVTDDGKPLFAVRKKLDSLTPKQIMNIIDPLVKEIVLKRLRQSGVNTEKKFTVPKDAFREPLYLTGIRSGKRTPVKSVRIQVPSTSMFNIRGYNLWVEPGANHHMIIYSKDKKRFGRIVTLFEAAKRYNEGRPVIDKVLDPGSEFVMSLQKNELVIWGAIPDDFEPRDKATYHLVFDKIYRVQKMDINKVIRFRKHYCSLAGDEKTVKNKMTYMDKVPSTLEAVKINISPAGFITYAED